MLDENVDCHCMLIVLRKDRAQLQFLQSDEAAWRDELEVA
jgi:hypothetical protein